MEADNAQKSQKIKQISRKLVQKMNESTKSYSLRLIPKNSQVMRLTTGDDDVGLFVAV